MIKKKAISQNHFLTDVEMFDREIKLSTSKIVVLKMKRMVSTSKKTFTHSLSSSSRKEKLIEHDERLKKTN